MSYQFKCDSTNGFSEVSGSISYKDEGIIFEYQNNYIGLVKGEVYELFIPFSQIEDIELIEKFLSKKLIITVNSLKGLDKFPVLEDYQIKIPIKKKTLEKAKEFIIKANYNLGQFKLDNIN